MDSIAAYVSIALSIGAIIMGIVNHKRIRSSCCGKEASVSLDIENTTPPAIERKPLYRWISRTPLRLKKRQRAPKERAKTSLFVNTALGNIKIHHKNG